MHAGELEGASRAILGAAHTVWGTPEDDDASMPSQDGPSRRAPATPTSVSAPSPAPAPRRASKTPSGAWGKPWTPSPLGQRGAQGRAPHLSPGQESTGSSGRSPPSPPYARPAPSASPSPAHIARRAGASSSFRGSRGASAAPLMGAWATQGSSRADHATRVPSIGPYDVGYYPVSSPGPIPVSVSCTPIGTIIPVSVLSHCGSSRQSPVLSSCSRVAKPPFGSASQEPGGGRAFGGMVRVPSAAGKPGVRREQPDVRVSAPHPPQVVPNPDTGGEGGWDTPWGGEGGRKDGQGDMAWTYSSETEVRGWGKPELGH